MTRNTRTPFFAAVLIFLSSFAVLAANNSAEDTDTFITDAKVVEVTDKRISVIARSGVEHVIALDSRGTKVKINNRVVSLKEVKKGDVITIELDEKNIVKLAKNIEVKVRSGAELARNRR